MGDFPSLSPPFARARVHISPSINRSARRRCAGVSYATLDWKGAIRIGLVRVPEALYPVSEELGIDWLNKCAMDPVSYKRINRRTGKEIKIDDVVKGIKQKNGEYVVLSDEQIKAALPVHVGHRDSVICQSQRISVLPSRAVSPNL